MRQETQTEGLGNTIYLQNMLKTILTLYIQNGRIVIDQEIG